jgi:hypothetical protein
MGRLVLEAEEDLRGGRFPGRLPAFWMAAMDLIDKGIKTRRGGRHWYLPAAAEARERRPSRDNACRLRQPALRPPGRWPPVPGVQVRKMSDPAASPAGVSAAQEGGSR